MKAASFDYVRPADVAEALRVLSERRGGAKLLAGGQSLGPMLNLRLARPQMLIDVARIDVLRRIEDMGAKWRIGAAVTHARIEDARDTLRGAEMLTEVAAGIAHRAIRNRGTIGGSVAHADPAADWPLALAALGATVNLRSARGRRDLPLESVVLGVFTTVLGDDEIIESIDVPKLSPTGCYGYYKFCRKIGDFAEASAAAVFDPETGAARIYLGALRSTPLPLATLARAVALQGHAAGAKESVAHTLTQAAPDLDPVERRMAIGAVMRALDQVFKFDQVSKS
jgi:aerobic carbon-monoxide dehydrogenase medium subunit